MINKFNINKDEKILCFTQVEIDGLTGRIKFDQRGVRTEFELEIVELKKHGLEKVEIRISLKCLTYDIPFRLDLGVIFLE